MSRLEAWIVLAIWAGHELWSNKSKIGCPPCCMAVARQVNEARDWLWGGP